MKQQLDLAAIALVVLVIIIMVGVVTGNITSKTPPQPHAISITINDSDINESGDVQLTVWTDDQGHVHMKRNDGTVVTWDQTTRTWQHAVGATPLNNNAQAPAVIETPPVGK